MLENYKANFRNYDILMADSSYKVQNSYNFISKVEKDKVNVQEYVPKMAKFERDMANLRVIAAKGADYMKTGQEVYKPDIFTINDATYSVVNDNMKSFLKVVYLMVKTTRDPKQIKALK
jgi:hypothetical protein